MTKRVLCYFVGVVFIGIVLMTEVSGADCENQNGEVCIICDISPDCARPTMFVVLKRHVMKLF